MTRLYQIAAIVAGAALSAAAPAEVLERGEAFSIDQVPGPKVFKSGPLAVKKVYDKYAKVGAIAPSAVVDAAAAASQTGTITANPESYDESYLCPVVVGTQTMNLDFDTGSADLWVFSVSLPSSESAGHSPLYNEKGTLMSGYTWDISYGDGSGASGTVYADKVAVGAVTATSQAVEAATSVSSEFTQDTQNDGLLGLAFSSINTVQPVQQTTFFDTVKSTLKKKLFTATLKHNAAGSYDFGYIDTTKYTGSISYVSVNTANGYWQFTADNVTGNSIMDTGTTLLYLPSSTASNYYAQVPSATYSNSQGGYIFSCSATLPNFYVSIGGQTFTVPGSYLNYAPVSSTQCFGGIQPNTGIGFSIFGDMFMKNQFVVFDETQSSPRLGIAPQKH